MKKLASLFVVAGMLFLSCGNKNAQEESVVEEEPIVMEEEPVEEDTTAVVDEAATTEEAAPAATQTKTTTKKATKKTTATATVTDDSKAKSLGSAKNIDANATITLQPVDNSKKSSEPSSPSVSGGKEVKF